MLSADVALGELQTILSQEEWSIDTLEAIAEIMEAAGYSIEDSSIYEEGED